MTFWQSCRKHGERILVNSSLLFLQESEKRSCHQVIEPAVGFIRVLPLLSGSGVNRAATTKQTQNETLCCKALPLSCVQVLPSWCDDIIWARFRGSGTMVSGSHLSPTQEQSWALSDINLLPLEENKTTNRWRHMKAAACHQGELSHIHSLTDMLAVVLNTMVSYFNILLLWHHLFTLSPVCVFVHACEYEACLTLWGAESWIDAWWEVPVALECVQPDVECMTLTQPSFLSFYYLCIFILTAAAVNLSTKLRSSFRTSHSPYSFGGVIGSHSRFSEGFMLGLTGLMVLPPFVAALILCAITVTVCPAVHSERVLNTHTDENDKGRL